MFENLGDLDWKFIISVIILPVITLIARSVYDSWRLKGIYLSTIIGTGEAPGLKYEENGSISAVQFGIDIRVLNLTDKFLAIEQVKIKWDRVRSKHLLDLRWLEDNNPLVSPLDESIEAQDDLVIFPIMLPANGGSVRLHINARLTLKKRRCVVFKEQYNPIFESAEISDEEFFWGLRRGMGKVTMRIGGKVRSLPVCIWRDT